jgi:LacI family transcriptional regulator
VVDVARAAGVSTASVSRALSNPESVSEDIRGRVVQAAAILGYVRNGAGRALASLRTGVVGVVLPSLADGVHEQVLAALEERLRSSGYSVAVSVAAISCSLDATQKLMSTGVDAVASIGAGQAPECRGLAERRRTPWIRIIDDAEASDPDSLGIDLMRGGLTVARYLHELGHRRFALLSSPADAAPLVAAAGRGLQRALATLPNASVVECVVTGFDAASQAADRLMRQASPPTAIVCSDTETAAGAAKGCEDAGIAVPEQVSVIGVGDPAWARRWRPPLTVVRLPLAAAGRAAAERLLGRLTHQHAEIPTAAARLVVRGSSGPAR